MKSDGYGDAFPRSLLEAGRMDGPAPDALERELGRLGLTVGAAVVATTLAKSASGAAGLAANGAATTATATTTALSATKGAAFLSSTIGKLVVGALAISSVGTTLVIAQASHAPVEARLAPSSTTAPAPVAIVQRTPGEDIARADEGAAGTMGRESATQDEPPPVNGPAPQPPIESSAPSAHGTSALLPRSESRLERTTTPSIPSPSPAVSATDVPQPPAPTDTATPLSVSLMAEQVMLLDRARATASLRPDEALAALDAYASRFPGGELTDQAAVVRVEALVARGDRSTAERVAAPYLRGNDTSPIARRMRALLESPNGAP